MKKDILLVIHGSQDWNKPSRLVMELPKYYTKPMIVIHVADFG